VGLVEHLHAMIAPTLTQRQMARKLDIHESCLSKVLARKRRASDGLLARIEVVFPALKDDVEQYSRERRIAALRRR
jgi:plasmid maintenance system antidote protein VapI